MKRIFFTIIFLILLAGITISQYLFDLNRAKLAPIEPLVMPSAVISVADLGLHNAAADFAWLASIQYFGGRSATNYEKLDDYIELANKLDPRFSYPYAFATLIFPGLNEVDRSIEFAKKGIANGEPNWRIPYYLAATYHVNKNDAKKKIKIQSQRNTS